MHEPVAIHIGRQSRALLFTPRALRIAQKLLDGRDPRRALALERGPDVVISCAAAALVHELGDKADAGRVEKWLEAEPQKYRELEAAIVEAATRAYVALGILEQEERPPGEAGAQASSPGAPGT